MLCRVTQRCTGRREDIGDRNTESSTTHKVELRGVVHDLVEGLKDHGVDLEFHHWASSLHCGTSRKPHEAGLRYWSVLNPLGTELLQQACRESPGSYLNILSENKDTLVKQHLVTKGFSESFEIPKASHRQLLQVPLGNPRAVSVA